VAVQRARHDADAGSRRPSCQLSTGALRPWSWRCTVPVRAPPSPPAHACLCCPGTRW